MKIRRAFLYAAGTGTRLQPYTLEKPKPLLELFGRPLIEYILMYLSRIGVTHVTVNTWHLAAQFEALPVLARAHGISLSLSRQDALYEHGGDLATATTFLKSLEDGETFVALNADTICLVAREELEELASQLDDHTPVMLACYQSPANPLRIHEGRLIGIGGILYDERFTGLPYESADDVGMKLMHASIRSHLPPPASRLSFYGADGLAARIIQSGRDIACAPLDSCRRVEIGTVQDLESAETNESLKGIVSDLAGTQDDGG